MANRDIKTRAGKASSLSATDHDQNINGLHGTVERQTGTTYTVVYTDQGKTIELNNASMVCTLDAIATIAAASDTDNFWVILKNVNAADATVQRSGTDTIDGSASVTLSQYESIKVQTDSTGAVWNRLDIGSGVVTETATQTLTNKTIASGTYTGTQTGFVGDITGNADTVTTNANLTGDVTSVGNATTIANTVVDTNQLVDDSVTMAKLDSPVAGGTYVLSRLMGATTVGSTNATAYVDVGLPRWYSSNQHMGFQVLINGVIRLQYEHRMDIAAPNNAYIRVLKNGSSIFANIDSSGVWTAQSHDITVTAGDLIILQQYVNSSSRLAEWRNIRVTTANRTPAVA